MHVVKEEKEKKKKNPPRHTLLLRCELALDDAAALRR